MSPVISPVLTAVLVVIFVSMVIITGIFNRLVALKNRTGEAWAQIDVQLKLRSDLVPNLVEAVKGYAAHEKSVLENVIKARAMAAGAGGAQNVIEADNALSGALKSLFAVTENYPELKANENFIKLQVELAGIEEKIAYARQFYNECAMKYNQYQQAMPGVIFASAFGHKQAVFFQVEDADRQAPQVKF
jgi:LemA protein